MTNENDRELDDELERVPETAIEEEDELWEDETSEPSGMTPEEEARKAREIYASLPKLNAPATFESTYALNETLNKIVKGQLPFMGSIHDVCFHMIMTDKEFASDFLKTYAPEPWKEYCNFDELELEPTVYVDEFLKRHVADVSYIIPYKGDSGESMRLTLIVEHKAQGSKMDRRHTIENIMQYVYLTTIERDRDKPTSTQSAALLVYTGKDENYTAPTWAETHQAPAFAKNQTIRYEPDCVNLTRLFVDDELQGSPLVRAMCKVLACAGKRQLRENRKTLLKPFGEIANVNERVRSFARLAYFYVVCAANNIKQTFGLQELKELMEGAENTTMGRDIITLWDEVNFKAEQRGEERGRKRGREEGNIELIILGLKERYGKVSDLLQMKIRKLVSFGFSNNIMKAFVTTQTLDAFEAELDRLSDDNSRRMRMAG